MPAIKISGNKKAVVLSSNGFLCNKLKLALGLDFGGFAFCFTQVEQTGTTYETSVQYFYFVDVR
jgi:hypothetical protein